MECLEGIGKRRQQQPAGDATSQGLPVSHRCHQQYIWRRTLTGQRQAADKICARQSTPLHEAQGFSRLLSRLLGAGERSAQQQCTAPTPAVAALPEHQFGKIINRHLLPAPVAQLHPAAAV